MKGHVILSLKPLTGNSCKVPENILCPAIIVSPEIYRLIFQRFLISDFVISMIAEILNRISSRVYEIWLQLVTP